MGQDLALHTAAPNPTAHYRIADLCILREGDPNDSIIRKAPLLCIEIFSRGDTLKEMQERVDDYLHMGVEHIWLIDPIRREAFIAGRAGIHPLQDDAFAVLGTPIRIPLADIFHQLDLLAAGR